MTEVTDGSLWRLRFVEDLEIVLGIKYFDHFLFFLLVLLLPLWRLAIRGWFRPQPCTKGVALPSVHFVVSDLDLDLG